MTATPSRTKLASKLHQIAAAQLRVPEQIPVWKWAEERRYLPPSVTARGGPYRIEQTPFMQEPQEAFFDDRVQVTVLCMASRTGKTETEMNLTGYTIDHDPKHILWVYPTLDSAKKWRKEFFNPMAENSPCFKGKIRNPRSRDSDNTMFSIGFPGGRCAVIGANSPSAFRQIQSPIVICEEVDAMEDTVEGDPIALAFKRADNYPDCVKVVSSSPTVKGMSRVWDWLEKSDFRKWYCPCPRCQHEQVLMWANVRFSWPGADGKEVADPERACYVCENCKVELNDDERRAMVRKGRWVATQEFTGIRGYWLNGLVTLFPASRGFKNRMHQFAKEFLDAKKGGIETLKTWTNTFLCETWEEAGESISAEVLYNRREDYLANPVDGGRPVLPAGVLVLTAGVDVQANPARIEYEIVGAGEGGETWGVQYGIIEKRSTWNAAFDELDRRLQIPWLSEHGFELTPAAVGVDSGHETDEVYAYVRRCQPRRVYAFKGSAEGYGEPIVSRPRKSGVRAVALHMIGTVTAKADLFSRMRIAEPGPGMMHFPIEAARGYDAEYFRQLSSEVLVQKYIGGRKVVKFVKPAGRRNEALDIRCYAHAALVLLNPDYAKIKEKAGIVDVPEPEAEPGPVEREFNMETAKLEPAAVTPNTYKKVEDAPKASAPVAPTTGAVRLPFRRGNWATRW